MKGGLGVAAGEGQDRVALVFGEGQHVRPELLPQESHELHMLQVVAEAVQVEERAAFLDHVLEASQEHRPVAGIVGVDRDHLVGFPVPPYRHVRRAGRNADLQARLAETLGQRLPVGLHLGRQDVEVRSIHGPAGIVASLPPEDHPLTVGLLEHRDQPVAELLDAFGPVQSPGPAVKTVGVCGRNGLLAVVQVVRGDPAVVGLVANRAEGRPEMFAVGFQQMLPVAVRADTHLHLESPRPAGRDGSHDKIDQPPLGKVFPLVRVPVGVVPQQQRAVPPSLPGREPHADRTVHGVAAPDPGPVTGMAKPNAVGLEVADVLDHHQAGGWAVELELQAGEANDVDGLLRVVVLDAGGDQQVFASERVIRHAGDTAFDMADPGLVRSQDGDRLLMPLVGVYPTRAGILEPRLRVEHGPTAAGQFPLPDPDQGQAIRGDLKRHALVCAIHQLVGRRRAVR